MVDFILLFAIGATAGLAAVLIHERYKGKVQRERVVIPARVHNERRKR
tara:strand:- start:81 stop:224 length:144 start_codon:yes stop_codon:yes gene_type:complete